MVSGRQDSGAEAPLAEAATTPSGSGPTAFDSPPGAAEAGVTTAGKVLADKYELERPLGRGGMGEVWVARHLALQTPVAIKLIHAKLDQDDTATERFMREARAAANLRGDNVVQIFDYGVDGDTPYMVMELLEGETLSTRLSEGGPMSPSAVVGIIADVCRAVGRAHEAKIVHRDLKPDNIFITNNGDRDVAKVLDFGIAKVTSDEGKLLSNGNTQTGTLLGTPFYMSPEQAKNSKKADPRSDLWAIGVITYECLVGKRPFAGEHITDLVLKICTDPIPVPSENGSVPAGFDSWFRQACARDLDERFQTARELITSLRGVLGGTSSQSFTNPSFKAPATQRSNRGLLVGGVLGVAAVGLGIALWPGATPPPAVEPAAAAAPAQPEAAPKAEKADEQAAPAPTPAPPETISISLEGAPEGAKVYVGDRLLGEADKAITLPYAEGGVTLRVEAPGYESREFFVPTTADLSGVPAKLDEKVEAPKPKTKTKRKNSGKTKKADNPPKKDGPDLVF